MTIIGIDPGKSGGIAWIDCDLGGVSANAIKMPETPRDIYDRLFELATENVSAFVFIEKVGPMPKQGISSTAKFCRHAGHLEMALIGIGIAHEFVAPGVWQRNLGCLTKGDKNVTKKRAQELFPHLKITHALADALLIAEYGRRKRANV